jgi:hypothetical protein
VHQANNKVAEARSFIPACEEHDLTDEHANFADAAKTEVNLQIRQQILQEKE